MYSFKYTRTKNRLTGQILLRCFCKSQHVFILETVLGKGHLYLMLLLIYGFIVHYYASLPDYLEIYCFFPSPNCLMSKGLIWEDRCVRIQTGGEQVEVFYDFSIYPLFYLASSMSPTHCSVLHLLFVKHQFGFHQSLPVRISLWGTGKHIIFHNMETLREQITK